MSLHEQGVISPATPSSYRFEVHLVSKKGTSEKRCVLDFKGLNEITRVQAQIIPPQQKLLDAVGNHKYYTTLDLCGAYHAIPMDPTQSHMTSFRDPHDERLWKFDRMPFGLSTAVNTFAHAIATAMGDLNFNICAVYLDDICIPAD